MRRRQRHQWVRVLGISLLIVGMVHAPWPQADFHNVRHHDSPGQVCELHDHLLNWHPEAGQAKDVAILHWHWFLPTADPVAPGHSGDGPAIHAHVGGWDAPTPDSGPLITVDASSRALDPPPVSPFWELLSIARPAERPGLVAGSRPVRAFGSTFAPRISLASRLQRWSC